MKKIFFLLFILLGTFSQAQVNVVGYIQTNGVANYPTHIDSMGKGGYMSMQDSFKRNAIPCLRRKYGMAVYVQNLQKLYILKDSSCVNTWVEFSGGGGGSQDLQSVLNNGHSLDSQKNYQGTYAGLFASGQDINAFGFQAAYFNTGSQLNALGYQAASYNNKDNVNALGDAAARQNTGQDINALGISAADHNDGEDVNALGSSCAIFNVGDDVNALGQRAADHNRGGSVNALGNKAASSNNGSNVNALGKAAADSNIAPNVNALGEKAARYNEGTDVNALGQAAADSNIGTNVNAMGYGAASHNTGSNVNAFGNRAGENNTTSNVILFGSGAQATEDDQMVMTNSNAKATRIYFGCTEGYDKEFHLNNKSGYFMTANFSVRIDANQESYTIPFADNYYVENNTHDKDSFILYFPDPEDNCKNGGQRLTITYLNSDTTNTVFPVYLDQTYKIYYKGSSNRITSIAPGQTTEFYSDGIAWRTITSLPQPVINIGQTSNPYYIPSSGFYNLEDFYGGGNIYLPFPCGMDGSTITIRATNLGNVANILNTTGYGLCPDLGIVDNQNTVVSTINQFSISTFMAINGQWVQIFKNN
jgi:hypothetical protein